MSPGLLRTSIFVMPFLLPGLVAWFAFLVNGLPFMQTGTVAMLFWAMVTLCLSSGLLTLLLSPFVLRRLFMPRAINTSSPKKWQALLPVVKRQAKMLAVPQPHLLVYSGDTANAFLVGGVFRRQDLYLSEKLIDQLSQTEIEAVLAHELAHIHQRDPIVNEIFSGMVLFGFVLSYLLLGWWLDQLGNRYFALANYGRRLSVTLSCTVLLFPVWLLMLIYSRRSEYQADALASHMVGRQQYLSLLQRLKGICHDHITVTDGEYLRLPAFANRLRSYFSSHPSIHHRIIALLHA